MAETLLILGGTADARRLADQATKRWPDLRVITSLAGRTAKPRELEGEVQIGGFGGADGLAEYMIRENVSYLIDATHPFAAEISKNAVQAANAAKVAHLVFCRPPWRCPKATGITSVASIDEVCSIIGPESQRIFLAIGRQDVAAFSEFSDKFFLLRFVDPPDQVPPFARCHVLVGRPGTLETERTALKEFQIDTLIAKNGGSTASRAKVDAAIELGIKVILINPPPPPLGPHAETIDAALAWLEARINPVS